MTAPQPTADGKRLFLEPVSPESWAVRHGPKLLLVTMYAGHPPEGIVGCALGFRPCDVFPDADTSTTARVGHVPVHGKRSRIIAFAVDGTPGPREVFHVVFTP